MLMVVKLQRARFPGLTPVERRCQISPAVCPPPIPMAHAAPTEHAEHCSVETMDSAIGDAVANVAAAAAAVALAGLSAGVAPAAAAAGQSTAVMKACAPRCTAVSHAVLCCYVPRILLCRCPACSLLFWPTRGLQRLACLRALWPSPLHLQRKAAQKRSWP